MNNSLINVPVLITTFVRDSTLRQVFDVVKSVRPSILFLASDGPRPDNKQDEEMIKRCRKIFEEVDWDCEVHKLYAESNLGLLKNSMDALKYAFERVDRLIFLEDDILPSKSFFSFSENLLERYKNDLRVHMICGMNHLGTYEKPDADYFFSQKGSIWGFALWKRTFELFDTKLDIYNDIYGFSLLKDNIKKSNFKRIYIEIKNEHFRINASSIKSTNFELLAGLSMYLSNSLLIIPKYNMITCLGLSEYSAHAPNNSKKLVKPIRNLFGMKRFEISSIKDPKYIVRDVQYENCVEKIMGRNEIVSFYRKFESKIRRIIYK